MKAFLFLLFFIPTIVSFGQVPLTFEKGRGGWQFRENGLALTKAVAQDRFQAVPAAATEYRKYRSQAGLANTLAFIGGGLIGWPIGGAIAGGDPNWLLAGIGAGVVAIALPIESSAKKRAVAAVAAYNNPVGMVPAETPRASWAITTNNGVGLQVTF